MRKQRTSLHISGLETKTNMVHKDKVNSKHINKSSSEVHFTLEETRPSDTNTVVSNQVNVFKMCTGEMGLELSNNYVNNLETNI